MRKKHLISHGRQFVSHVLPAVIKPARTLWHEVIGFLFVCLAVIPGFSLVRGIRNYDGSPGALFRLILTLIFVVIMGGYGISSFLRARRISRS